MENTAPIEAVVFDVVETLFSLAPVAGSLEAHGIAPTTLDVFFARLLRDGFAHAAAGEMRTFPELADGALTVVAPSLTRDQRSAVLSSFGELEPHPDVVPALDRLRASGVRVAALTNGSGPNTNHLLQSNGLADRFDLVVSVDEVGVWKPRPEPYRYVVDRLELASDRVAMVAVHAWDTHGAHRAGLVTGWASRLEGVYATTFDRPDVSGRDLVEVVEGLLARSR